MPISASILAAFQDGIMSSEHSERTEKPLGSNCEIVELLSFIEEGRIVRVISKKSRLPAHLMETVQGEYNLLKDTLGDMIPSQAFFLEKNQQGRDMITALCAPVTIAYDIFASEKNWQQFVKEYQMNIHLQEDVLRFVNGYARLQAQNFVVDLFGEENLVITREGRLKYIDSFMINMFSRKTLRGDSEKRFQKLQELVQK